jgi:hypothetical protein
MTDGKHCPACGKDVGVWPIASAMLPNLIRCPHCRTRLAYRGVGRLLVGLVVLGLALAVGLMLFVAWLPVIHPALRLATFVALLLVAWVPVEVAVAVYLRRHKVLTRADEPPSG